MTVSDAWLLEPDNAPLIAISDHQMVEYIPAPLTFKVPGAPLYCNHVLLWQHNLVPIMDLGTLLGKAPSRGNSVNLLAFQKQPGTPIEYMAARVLKAPEKIIIDDDQACEMHEEISQGLLKSICLSSFMHRDERVTILDISRLCSVEFRDLANPLQQLESRFSNIDEKEVI